MRVWYVFAVSLHDSGQKTIRTQIFAESEFRFMSNYTKRMYAEAGIDTGNI